MSLQRDLRTSQTNLEPRCDEEKTRTDPHNKEEFGPTKKEAKVRRKYEAQSEAPSY